MPIPHVLHQTWKDDDVPPEYRGWQRSWRQKNPSFAYKLWTDEDLDALVAGEYPHLLEIFRSYDQNICRSDLGRYLILDRYGGVYADLDCECLRPIDALIANQQLVIASEPVEHENLPKAVERGLGRIICPSFIASRPNHRFWTEVVARIGSSASESDVLDATGPFLLSRALGALENPADVTVLPPQTAYPFSRLDCESGRVLDIEYWESATRDAYLIHYWSGGWWKGVPSSEPKLPNTIPVHFFGNGTPASSPPPTVESPKISCIMLLPPESGPEPVAAESYLQQTYPNRELIVVGVEQDRRGLDALARPGRSDIQLIHAPLASAEAATALAASAAKGEYICIWDAAALSDPQRLEYQYGVLPATGSQASFIASALVWEGRDERMGISEIAFAARSLLCAKSPFLADVQAAPESPDLLLNSNKVVGIDFPRLYIECADRAANEVAARPLRRVYTGSRYGAVLAELAKRIPPLAQANAAARGSPPNVLVNLVRFVSEDVGIGIASAGTCAALEAADIPFIEQDAGSRSRPGPRAGGPAPPRALNLLHVNPDHLVGRGAGDSFERAARWKDEFTIAAWVWEAAGIPHFWRELLPLVDEIWVPSSYVANSVAGHVPCPVVTLPHVVDPPAATFGRSAIGVPTGKFLFLFAFDALSNLDRKNPAGVLHAYCNAFEPHGDVQLILKCKNLTDAELEALHERRNGRSDIRIINQPMSRGDASSLIAACDCYVSLHRAEGFGLTMAEAMFYGKPVIATGYSGNVDFMAGGFGFLVNYGMTVTERDCGYYRAGTEWAEPDLDHASRLMRYVVDHPEVTGRIGRAAAEKMRNEYSAKAIGGRINDRLSLLMNSGAFGRYR